MTIRHWPLAVALLAAVATPAALRAQTPEDLPRVAVSVTAGVMRPLEAGVRSLYDGAFVPVTVEADVRVFGIFFVFGSGQFVSKDGEVVFDLPPAPEEHFPLRVRTSSVRVGGGVAVPWRKLLFTGAGGVSFTRFEEKWIGEDLPAATGHTRGFIVQGGAEYRVSRRFSAIGRVEYLHTPMDETRQVFPTFDLSGLSVAGGAAVRF